MYQEEKTFTLRFSLEASFPNDYGVKKTTRPGCVNGKRESNRISSKCCLNHSVNTGPGRRTYAIAENPPRMKLKWSCTGLYQTARVQSLVMTFPLLGLYLHIPFCRQRCDFCAFYLEIHREHRAEAFVRSLTHKITVSAEQHVAANRPVQSVYFGGGTPTALTVTRLTTILSEIDTHLSLTSDCEITVEAHPSTVSEEDLEQLY